MADFVKIAVIENLDERNCGSGRSGSKEYSFYAFANCFWQHELQCCTYNEKHLMSNDVRRIPKKVHSLTSPTYCMLLLARAEQSVQNPCCRFDIVVKGSESRQLKIMTKN